MSARRGRPSGEGSADEGVRRRTRRPPEPPQMPSGWRGSRRSSRARKTAERELRRHEARERVSQFNEGVRSGTKTIAFVGARAAVVLVVVVASLWLVATAINSAARWNAVRIAEREAAPEAQAERARSNLLLIGVTEGQATGFLVLRALPDQEQVFGIAVPDGAFIEIPGQGFDRIGESFTDGPERSLSAVTNFFGVPFNTYVVIDSAAYQEALTSQDVSRALESSSDTNLTDEELARWQEVFAAVESANVALVPMPVKPVNVGDQTYFEPQRDEIADLLASWWGVTIDAEDGVVRVIVYNGSGEPGVAGLAAQELIRGGFRVIDTKNADSFDYATTQIVLQGGDREAAERARDVLGVGEIVDLPADQEVADVIIIVGADYE